MKYGFRSRQEALDAIDALATWAIEIQGCRHPDEADWARLSIKKMRLNLRKMARDAIPARKRP